MILGLTGYAQSGKDTLASCLGTGQGFVRVAFADAVREAALAIDPIVVTHDGARDFRLSHLVGWYGWDQAKQEPEVRRLLQRVGTEMGREIFGPNIWIDIAMRKAAKLGDQNVVFTDVRYANEAEAIRFCGGKILRINRPGYGPVNTHASDQIDFVADFYLTNDSTPEVLYLRALKLLRLPVVG